MGFGHSALCQFFESYLGLVKAEIQWIAKQMSPCDVDFCKLVPFFGSFVEQREAIGTIRGFRLVQNRQRLIVKIVGYKDASLVKRLAGYN